MCSSDLEVIKRRMGFDALHVPYKGAAQALTDLLGGQVQLAVLPVHTALPHARSGKLNAIAVSGERRSVLAPDLPTFADLGLKNLGLDLYFWVAGPPGLPADIARKWTQELASVLQSQDVRDTFQRQGMVPNAVPPDQQTREIAADVARFQLPELEKNLPPTLAVSAMMARVPRKALTWMVYSMQQIDAQAALSLGIVSQVVPLTQLDDACEQIAAGLAQRSRPALVAVKDYFRSAPGMDARAASDYAANLLATVFSSIQK